MEYKIHLIKTPEYELEEYLKVCEFLQSFQGPLEFISSDYDNYMLDFVQLIKEPLMEPYPFKFKNSAKVVLDPLLYNSLSWDEIFSFCEAYRKWKEIPRDEFVILLTNRRNEYNWFSSFDQKNNAFVHTSDWEHYVADISVHYPVAYEVVANIVRTFMNLDIENIPNKYIHEPFKACMNDFCRNKSEIIIKISNARICTDCLARIKSENGSDLVLNQVQSIFNGIHSEFNFKVEDKSLEPSKIIVSDKAVISLKDYDIDINMPEIWKTLYIFFLRHPEGVLLVDLDNFTDELKGIYKICRPKASDKLVNSTIANLVHHSGASFNQKRGRLNKKIVQLLKEPRFKHYIIDGQRNDRYFINISSDLVDIRF